MCQNFTVTARSSNKREPCLMKLLLWGNNPVVETKGDDWNIYYIFIKWELFFSECFLDENHKFITKKNTRIVHANIWFSALSYRCMINYIPIFLHVKYDYYFFLFHQVSVQETILNKILYLLTFYIDTALLFGKKLGTRLRKKCVYKKTITY